MIELSQAEQNFVRRVVHRYSIENWANFNDKEQTALDIGLLLGLIFTHTENPDGSPVKQDIH